MTTNREQELLHFVDGNLGLPNVIVRNWLRDLDRLRAENERLRALLRETREPVSFYWHTSQNGLLDRIDAALSPAPEAQDGGKETKR